MLSFSNFTRQYYSDVLLLAENAFGANYLTENDLNNYLSNSHQHSRIALFNHDFAGFSFYRFVKSDDLDDYFSSDSVKVIKANFPNHELICIRQQTAVIEKFRNKGIAEQLVGIGVEDAKQKNAGIISIVWNSDGCMMKNVLLKHNFKVLAELKNYWYADSLTKKYDCAVCGKPPCCCNALLMGV